LICELYAHFDDMKNVFVRKKLKNKNETKSHLTSQRTETNLV